MTAPTRPAPDPAGRLDRRPSPAARLAAALQLDLLDGHRHGRLPPAGSRLVAGDGPDDTGRGGISRLRLRSVDGRLALLALAVAVAYGPQLARLPDALGIDSPLAYAALAPALAVLVAVGAVRTAEPGPPRLPLRPSDRICGGAFLALAVVVALVGPRWFGFDTGPFRVGLASLPFFLVGSVWLLFGGRVVYWLRSAFLAAALVAPVWYAWAVGLGQRASTAATWHLVRTGAGWFDVPASTVAGTGMVELDGQLVAVSASCSGASAVLGWVIVALSLTSLLAGTGRAKLAWVLTGAAAAWVGNGLRIGALVLVGELASAEVALEWVHPWAGLVLVGVVSATMLALLPRFGLARRAVVTRRARQRLAAVAPDPWTGGAAVLAAVAVVVALTGAGGWRYEPLGGRNGERNRAVTDVLDAAGSGGGLAVAGGVWSPVAFGPVEWAPHFFGEGAQWYRYAVFPDTAGGSGTAWDAGPAWAVNVDTTSVSSLDRLDAYTLEACYGFHGFRIDRVELASTLPARPAEQLEYREPRTGVGTFVLSWRQRIAGGRVERVVLSAPYVAGDPTPENAGLPGRDQAAGAVTALARDLAGEAGR